MRLLRPGPFHPRLQIIRQRDSRSLCVENTPASRPFSWGRRLGVSVLYNTAQPAPLYSRKMTMRPVRAAMLLAIGLTAAEDKPDIAKLAWMAGCWEGQIGPVQIEEQRNKPVGGTMLGLSRNMKDGKVVFSE